MHHEPNLARVRVWPCFLNLGVNLAGKLWCKFLSRVLMWVLFPLMWKYSRDSTSYGYYFLSHHIYVYSKGSYTECCKVYIIVHGIASFELIHSNSFVHCSLHTIHCAFPTKHITVELSESFSNEFSLLAHFDHVGKE